MTFMNSKSMELLVIHEIWLFGCLFPGKREGNIVFNGLANAFHPGLIKG